MARYSQLRKKYEARAHLKILCRLCSAIHPIRLRPIYRAKSPEERLLGNFCGNCLSMAHRTEGCASDGRCRRCGDKHYTTLHTEEKGSPPPEPYKPWSVIMEEDERENGEGVLSICASDNEIVGIDGGQDEAIFWRWEPRLFRPLLQHERQKKSEGRSESRLFRPLLLHERQQKKEGRSEPRLFRHHRSQHKYHRQHNQSFYKRSEWQSPYQVSQTRDNRALTRAKPVAPSTDFRNGLPNLNAIAGSGLLPMVSILTIGVVKIEAKGRLELVRALIDVCSPSSVISADLVHALKLDQTRVGDLTGCMVLLRGKHGENKSVATQAIVTPHFHRVTEADV